MKRAVVIGGGIGGLATAKVLSNHFEKVIVYDSQIISQAPHLHVLLKSGQDLLEKFFPGMKIKLLSHECPEINWSLDTFWENHSGIFPRYNSSVKTLMMSRSLLQLLMKTDLQTLSHVEFIEGRISSIEEAPADLIVISGGQNFPLESFLGNVICSEKREQIDLSYQSYEFDLDELKMKDFKQYYFQMDPPNSFIGGVISPIENKRIIATLIEKGGSASLCQSHSDFLKKAKKIKSSKFLEIIEGATPLTAISTFCKTTTHRRSLDHAKMPKNVIIVGDVLTSLNPIFGQGMTHTLMQVNILNTMISQKNFSTRKFHLKSYKIGEIPSLLSSVGSAESGFKKEILRSYLKLCQRSKLVHHLFLRQLHSLGIKRQI